MIEFWRAECEQKWCVPLPGHAPTRNGMHSSVSFPFPTGWDTDMMVGTGAVTLGSGVIDGVKPLKI